MTLTDLAHHLRNVMIAASFLAVALGGLKAVFS